MLRLAKEKQGMWEEKEDLDGRFFGRNRRGKEGKIQLDSGRKDRGLGVRVKSQSLKNQARKGWRRRVWTPLLVGGAIAQSLWVRTKWRKAMDLIG